MYDLLTLKYLAMTTNISYLMSYVIFGQRYDPTFLILLEYMRETCKIGQPRNLIYHSLCVKADKNFVWNYLTLTHEMSHFKVYFDNFLSLLSLINNTSVTILPITLRKLLVILKLRVHETYQQLLRNQWLA